MILVISPHLLLHGHMSSWSGVGVFRFQLVLIFGAHISPLEANMAKHQIVLVLYEYKLGA